MGTEIKLKDGREITICSDRDFQDLIREALGNEAVDLYIQRITADPKERLHFPSWGIARRST